jgi:hypothetical protein
MTPRSKTMIIDTKTKQKFDSFHISQLEEEEKMC